MELVVQFPARGSTQVLLCLFPGVLWLWHFLYSVGPHPVSSLYICTSVVSRAFMAGAASHAGDADSSRAPGLTSGLQGSVNVHRGALLFVPQWQCISSFVFYIVTHDSTVNELWFDITLGEASKKNYNLFICSEYDLHFGEKTSIFDTFSQISGNILYFSCNTLFDCKWVMIWHHISLYI